MTPGVFNLDLYRGDSYSWQIKLWHDTAQTLPVSLTGATVKAEIRDRSAGARIVVMTTVITLPNTVQMSVTPTMYTTMPATGVWDLQVTFPDTTVNTMLRGAVIVTPDVTDSAAITLLAAAAPAPEPELLALAQAPGPQVTTVTAKQSGSSATMARVRNRNV